MTAPAGVCASAVIPNARGSTPIDAANLLLFITQILFLSRTFFLYFSACSRLVFIFPKLFGSGFLVSQANLAFGWRDVGAEL